MKFLKIFFGLLLGINFLQAQTTTTTVKGIVVNEATGNPLPAAGIAIVGTKKGTTADEAGKFTISIPSDNKPHKILVSYLNYTSKTVNVVAGTFVTIKLTEITKDDGEVLVQTGYGNPIKKKEIAASVSTVSAKDLKDIPVSSVAEALNGRLGGVTATTAEGSPDAEVKIKVRGGISISGDNSPLYVIDGVVLEGGINNLVLQDIQDITVLKDAAATAIYGSRGANGVIVISTKTGKVGKLKLSYNAYVGFKSLTKTLDLLTPYDFIMYQYERATIANDLTGFYSKYGSTFDTLAAYKNQAATNWQDVVLGNQGQSMQHNVTFSGGTKQTNYLFSYTNQTEKAIVLNSKYNKNQFNFKIEHKFGKKIKLGVSARYTNQNVYGAGTSADGGSVSFNRLRNIVKFRPFLRPGESIEDVNADPDLVGNGLQMINPVQLSNQEFRKKTTNAFNVTANFNYNISKRLSFKSTIGYDRNLVEDKQFNDSISPATANHSRVPLLNFDSTQKTTISNSNVLNYSIKGYKNRHDIDILLGEETNFIENKILENQYELPHGVNRDTSFENIGKWGNQYNLYPKRNVYQATILSFFGRVNYTLDKKYIFSLVLRADGSSKFSPDNRWGYFPSASFAWKLSSEKFMDNCKLLNDVKLRLTYGSNGNARIGDYLYLNTFRHDQTYYGLGGASYTGYNPTALGNTNLLWESVLNRNLGLDFSIFNKKVDISIDYYYNTSKNLLLNVPIASTYGYSSQIQNIGQTKSSGVEVQLNATILRKKNGFNWNANFNIAFNSNEVVALRSDMPDYKPVEGAWNSISGKRDYIEKIGSPVGSFYGFVTDGFYKASDFVSYSGIGGTAIVHDVLKPGVTDIKSSVLSRVKPGSLKLKDLNGDGIVDEDNDRTIIGNPNPKFTGGLNQQFSYKNFDASIFVNFSVGGDVYNANKLDFTNSYVPNANMLAINKQRYTLVDATGAVVTDLAALDALNKDAKIWQPSLGSDGFNLHSWAIEDASYLRINNITLGYSLPIKTLAKLGISKFRLYVTGNNLAIITKYSGYDPEVSVKSHPTTPSLDYSAYPKSRSFIIGLNVTF
jgi:TonB-dependent starch-binding outer membrane protein SusC